MRLLPGIRIVDVPPPPGDGLPVMDVPVFVGFAERGPLDRPVAIEDPVQYAAVFGGIVDLVPRPRSQLDDQGVSATPRMLRAHLPAAVASFLAGGGRRCYVIRVADRQQASTALFPVAGLRLATFNRETHPWRWQLSAWDFRLQAASPGAWADRHELAVRVRGEALHSDDRVARGDVLRVRRPDAEQYVGWLRADRPGLLAEILAAADPLAWLWTPALGDEAPGESPPAPTAGFDDPLAAADSPPSPLLASPPGTVDADGWLVERVTVDLALRHPTAGEIRRENCGLSAGAANLPWFEADAEGRYDAGEELPGASWPLAGVPASALAELACSPDGVHPLVPESDDWMLLPVATDAYFGPWRAALGDGRDALSRNGLARYASDLFVDPAWSERLRRDELLRWANEIRFFATAPRRLRGLHGALGRDDAVSRDATWIAVPDAVHPGWMRAPDPAPHDGELLSTSDEPCTCVPATAFDGCLPPPPRIPRPPRFDLAALRVPADGATAATAVAPADREWLIFADDTASPPGAEPISFEVQIAQQPDFSDQRPLPAVAGSADSSAQWFPPPAQASCAQPPTTPGPRHFAPVRYALRLAAGLHFLRARTWRSGRYSEWSATVEVLARSGDWQLNPDQNSGNAAVAYRVHCALLDLCAASREHFALLSVPERWDAARLTAHTTALRQRAAADIEASQATSFAALHHPWLLRREAASDGSDSPAALAGELHAHPPEGAVLGVYAQRSRKRGAWAAAGLDPLAEAVALVGMIDAEGIESAGANPIELRPSGICATRATTLWDVDPDWQAVGVRRLFILLRRLARREGERYTFEPNDLTLRRSLELCFDTLLQQLMQRGAFRGARASDSYLLRTASGVVASQEIERGECSLEIRVAPSRPLRFLTLRVLRSGEQLLLEES